MYQSVSTTETFILYTIYTSPFTSIIFSIAKLRVFVFLYQPLKFNEQLSPRRSGRTLTTTINNHYNGNTARASHCQPSRQQSQQTRCHKSKVNIFDYTRWAEPRTTPVPLFKSGAMIINRLAAILPFSSVLC